MITSPPLRSSEDVKMPQLTPPARPAICRHDVRGPLRQACCCCGACDHLDFRVTDAVWAAVVPVALSGAHVCLRCFDAMAAEVDVSYAEQLERICFVGDRACLEFEPVSAVDCWGLRPVEEPTS